MQKLVFINGAGNQIDLTSGNFGIVNWEGLSNTDLNIQSQQVPFEDGGVFLDALMEQREIALTVAIYDGNNLELRYQKKRELISALNPKLGEGVLTYTNDYLSKQIKAVPQIPLFENKNSNDAGTLKASVAFTCCNPYWEDTEETTVEISLGETVKVENNGDKDIGFTLDFFQTDGVTNPKFTSITENKILKYDGLLEQNLKISTETGKKDAITEELNFNVLAQNVNLFSVCKGRGLILAGGSAGVLLTSEYSESWQTQNSGGYNPIYSITYSKTQGVYLLTTDSIRKSIDGVNWKVTNESANFLYYDDVTGYTFAIDSLEIKRSFDCENWDVVYTLPEGMTFSIGENLIRDSNGLYNLTDKYTLTSPDGENWTLTSTSGGTNKNIKKVIYRNGKYIAVGSTHIITSADGTTYTDQAFTGYDFRDVVYWDKIGSYIALSRSVGLLISSDGDNWNESISAKGYCFLIDDDSLLIFSNVIDKYSDLTNYVEVHSTVEQIYASCEGISSTYLLSSGSNGIIYKCDDKGQITTVYNSDVAPTNMCKIKNYVLGCGNKILLKTTDEANWISKATVNIRLKSIAYDEKNGVIIIVGANGTVLRSVDDGETWNPQAIGTNNLLSSVCYSKTHSKFIVVGENIIADSPDGITWNLNTNPPASFSRIVCAKDSDILIAYLNTNNSGRIYRSTDIENWTLVETMPANITINGIAYISEYGYFFAVGYFGRIYLSSNGLVWEQAFTYQENNYLRTITFSKQLDKILFSGTFFVECTQKEIESVISNISSDSDLGMSLEKGVNELFITADSGIFNARIKYRQKYIGV